MDFVLKYFYIFGPALTISVYYGWRILFYIVRRIDKYLTMWLYSRMDPNKVKLIDGCNAIKDTYKDEPSKITVLEKWDKTG